MSGHEFEYCNVKYGNKLADIRAAVMFTHRDCKYFNYVVQSRTYGDNGWIVTTSRGNSGVGRGRGKGKGAVLAVVRAKKRKHLRENDIYADVGVEVLAYHKFDKAVEGQDVRIESGHMVVASQGTGEMFTFNYTDIVSKIDLADKRAKNLPSEERAKVFPIDISPIAKLQLPVTSVLHVRLMPYYEEGVGEQVAAIFSAGFAEDGLNDAIIAADVTDLKNPRFLSLLQTGVESTEEIMVNERRVYVGGFASHKLGEIDAKNLTDMKVEHYIDEPYYQQMVSERMKFQNQSFVVSALWGERGGAAIFEANNRTGNLQEIAYFNDYHFGKANRVLLLPDTVRSNPVIPPIPETRTSRVAVLPLEEDPYGGIGLMRFTIFPRGEDENGIIPGTRIETIGKISFTQPDSRVYCVAPSPTQDVIATNASREIAMLWAWSARTCSLTAFTVEMYLSGVHKPCTYVLNNSKPNWVHPDNGPLSWWGILLCGFTFFMVVMFVQCPNQLFCWRYWRKSRRTSSSTTSTPQFCSSWSEPLL